MKQLFSQPQKMMSSVTQTKGLYMVSDTEGNLLANPWGG